MKAHHILLSVAVLAAGMGSVVAVAPILAASGNGWQLLLLTERRIPFLEVSANGTDNVLLYQGAASVQATSPGAVYHGNESSSIVTMAPAGKICQLTPTKGGEPENSTRFVMLKLATSGSTWIGDLLRSQKAVTMKPEIITGSHAHRMTIKRITSKLEEYLNNHSVNTPLLGFSLNGKNIAPMDFPAFALRNSARLVVWIRSNVVSHAVGKIRAGMLHDLCNTNNVRLNDAEKCALSDHETIPLAKFREALTQTSLYHAIHMGAAYRPPANTESGRQLEEEGGGACRGSPPVFEMFYEELLADKATALRRLFTWLGREELLETDDGAALADKTVKSTPASLRGLIANFKELEDSLVVSHPCYVAQLRSNGREVMPLCPPFVSTSSAEGVAELEEDIKKLAEAKFPKQPGSSKPSKPAELAPGSWPKAHKKSGGAQFDGHASRIKGGRGHTVHKGRGMGRGEAAGSP